MSSATSPQQDRVIAQQRAHEPSMEEILASIRRIIADDQRPVGRPVADEPAAAPLAPDRPANLDIEAPAPVNRVESVPDLEPDAVESAAVAALAQEVVAVEAPAAQEEIIELTTPVAPTQAMTSQATMSQDAPRAAAPEPARLISRETDAAVAAQFHQLSETLMADNARRVDELTRDLLRPMLKSWLDDNLPVLVERLVKAEIERVARGGR